VYGVPRNVEVPIVIEAFLDEREPTDGGAGQHRVWVRDQLIVDAIGPNLQWGQTTYRWSMSMYLFKEQAPVPYSRASFWKVARMLVY
jgi:hypothetical protein